MTDSNLSVGYGVREANLDVKEWIGCSISFSKRLAILGREHDFTYVPMLRPGDVQTLSNQQVAGLRNELRVVPLKISDPTIIQFSAQLLALTERIASDPALSLIIATRGRA